MNPIHKRFRERFPIGKWTVSQNLLQHDILAFIDELLAEEREKLYNDPGSLVVRTMAQNKERASLIALLEGMRQTDVTFRGETLYSTTGYNQALDDLLTHLRGEEKPWKEIAKNPVTPPKFERLCTEEGEILPNSIHVMYAENCLANPNPPQKKTEKCGKVLGTVQGAEVTCAGTVPCKLHKEGASFSGRKCEWCLKGEITNPEWEQENTRGEWHPLCKRCAARRLKNPYNALLNMRKIAPKETTTPQSREQEQSKARVAVKEAEIWERIEREQGGECLGCAARKSSAEWGLIHPPFAHTCGEKTNR